MCRLFRRSSPFDKCSARVLHSHNNFGGFDAGGPVFGAGKSSSGRHAEGAVLRINVAVKIRLRSRTKEAAALDAAASSKALFLTSGRLVVVAAVGRTRAP